MLSCVKFMRLLQQFLNLVQFANLRYHIIPFRRDAAYDAIYFDKSMPDFSLLYDEIGKGFSVSLRDQRCLTL